MANDLYGFHSANNLEYIRKAITTLLTNTGAWRGAPMKIPDWQNLEKDYDANISIISPFLKERGFYTEEFRSDLADAEEDLGPVIFELPTLSLSAFRDPEALKSQFESYPLMTVGIVNNSWGASYQLVRRSPNDERIQNKSIKSYSGPYSLDRLQDLAQISTFTVDALWTSIQSEVLIHQRFRNETGNDLHRFIDLYKLAWSKKDQPKQLASNYQRLLMFKTLNQEKESNQELRDFFKAQFLALSMTKEDAYNVPRFLEEVYLLMARAALAKNNLEATAEFSKVAYDLRVYGHSGSDPTEVLEEFRPFLQKWRAIEESSSTLLAKLSLVRREGLATWATAIPYVQFAEGRLSPLTAESKQAFEQFSYTKYREEQLRLSPSNPYRLGFEMMERIEAKFGWWITQMLGNLTEWPIRALMKIVPHHMIKDFKETSPFSPNFRFKIIDELTVPDWAGNQSPERVMLELIHPALDRSINGGIYGAALTTLFLNLEEGYEDYH